MPAGITIEAGQADLMLISWLGVDSLNKGLRFIACSGAISRFTAVAPVPEKPCDMTSTWIAMRYMPACECLFSLRLHMRQSTPADGTERQAGFLQMKELAGSEGVLLVRRNRGTHSHGQARMDPPAQLTPAASLWTGRHRALSQAFRGMFREGFVGTFSHTRTAVAAKRRMQFLHADTGVRPGRRSLEARLSAAEWDVRQTIGSWKAISRAIPACRAVDV